MTRRAEAHDYSRPGTYHITLHVAEEMGAPLGQVVGNAAVPDGHPDAPRVALSPIGQMVEHELLGAIHSRYPMAEVHDYVVMPEHLHFLLIVKAPIISPQGKRVPLGQVIAGFKYGCNSRYWEMLGLPPRKRQAEPAATLDGGSVPAGSAGRVYPTLFAPGFCDVMPVSLEQLATQRAYIQGNPRSRLLRTSHRAWLTTRRGSITTALTVAALRGYLRRECGKATTPEALAAIEERLLVRPAEPAATLASGGSSFIACDSYGDGALLGRHLLPVVCHRRDSQHFAEQKARCLEEAATGAVLVSARIAKGEQEIVDEAVRHGFPVVLIHDNGFPERYHPSAAQIDLCAAGRLLLVSPWRYLYRGKGEAISVDECKAMNCVAQALCRQKDSWWRTMERNTEKQHITHE